MTVAVEPAVEGGLRAALRDAAPLLAGIGLLMAGNGLTSTLLGIRAGLEGFRPGVVGVVLAGYYLGFVAGSMVTPSTIARVGHIRVFAGLASLASAVVLVHVVRPEPATWFALRAVSGLCISGLYVVCETWLNGAATNRTRGSLLGSYMVVVSGSLLLGQLLFSVADPGGFAPFVLASVLVSMSVVPVSMATITAPVLPDPVPLSLRRLVAVAPLAPVGAAASGFASAAMIGAGVVYAAEAGFTRTATGAFVGAALLGGLLLQVPLGSWSDRVDRRAVIAAAALAAAAVAVAASMVGTDRRVVLIVLTTVAGGMAFPLYSLVNAHLNDYLDADLAVSGGARMVLVNGAGAVAGPIVGSAAVGAVAPGALFLVIAASHALVGAYALYRMTRRSAPPEDDRASFVPHAPGVGPTVAAMGDVEPDVLYPPSEGTYEVDGDVVAYREQGTGAPVVFVGQPRSIDTWAEMMPALATDGVRALAPRVDTSDAVRAREQLLGLLRHAEIASATFVGAGDAVEVVARMAAEDPDRVDAAVVSEPDIDRARSVVPDPDVVIHVLDASLLGDPEALADGVVAVVRRLPEDGWG